jgi:hypothetical protein
MAQLKVELGLTAKNSSMKRSPGSSFAGCDRQVSRIIRQLSTRQLCMRSANVLAQVLSVSPSMTRPTHGLTVVSPLVAWRQRRISLRPHHRLPIGDARFHSRCSQPEPRRSHPAVRLPAVRFFRKSDSAAQTAWHRAPHRSFVSLAASAFEPQQRASRAEWTASSHQRGLFLAACVLG